MTTFYGFGTPAMTTIPRMTWERASPSLQPTWTPRPAPGRPPHPGSGSSCRECSTNSKSPDSTTDSSGQAHRRRPSRSSGTLSTWVRVLSRRCASINRRPRFATISPGSSAGTCSRADSRRSPSTSLAETSSREPCLLSSSTRELCPPARWRAETREGPTAQRSMVWTTASTF